MGTGTQIVCVDALRMRRWWRARGAGCFAGTTKLPHHHWHPLFFSLPPLSSISSSLLPSSCSLVWLNAPSFFFPAICQGQWACSGYIHPPLISHYLSPYKTSWRQVSLPTSKKLEVVALSNPPHSPFYHFPQKTNDSFWCYSLPEAVLLQPVPTLIVKGCERAINEGLPVSTETIESIRNNKLEVLYTLTQWRKRIEGLVL